MSPQALREIVLVVDDAPQSLGALCAELEAEGYTVLMAPDGESALQRLELVSPDAILLDALMPGLTGFETCRRVKARPEWAHVPVIFMTGLAETEDIVRGFEAGGVDYVVKPARAAEVLARLATHVRNARAVRQAREAVDVGGLGVLVVDARGRIAWRSPQAQRWLQEAGSADATHWLQGEVASQPLPDGRRLVARRVGEAGLGEALWLLQPPATAAASPDAPASRIASAALTPREKEVLSWVAKGKTNRDVAEILGMSPRTVNKHLEHVFEKLGVETRAAAAALASRGLAGV
ncbi:response regulator transcription factor [Roseateles paludis]|uniref:Response regulator transcription factor n=1 Tax=Roseateles paludis TaxID=3145238 RepID=A0ABV0FWY7_9BURK